MYFSFLRAQMKFVVHCNFRLISSHKKNKKIEVREIPDIYHQVFNFKGDSATG